MKVREILENGDFRVIDGSIVEKNNVIKTDTTHEPFIKDQWKIDPFKDANERLDMIYLLECNGWNRVGRAYGNNIRFKRPGSSSPTSAILDTNTKLFSVFTTSTDLDVKAYNASMLFAHFECGGDYGESYKRLIADGYGEKM